MLLRENFGTYENKEYNGTHMFKIFHNFQQLSQTHQTNNKQTLCCSSLETQSRLILHVVQ